MTAFQDIQFFLIDGETVRLPSKTYMAFRMAEPLVKKDGPRSKDAVGKESRTVYIGFGSILAA
jgi:hypothetical protein